MGVWCVCPCFRLTVLNSTSPSSHERSRNSNKNNSSPAGHDSLSWLAFTHAAHSRGCCISEPPVPRLNSGEADDAKEDEQRASCNCDTVL